MEGPPVAPPPALADPQAPPQAAHFQPNPYAYVHSNEPETVDGKTPATIGSAVICFALLCIIATVVISVLQIVSSDGNMMPFTANVIINLAIAVLTAGFLLAAITVIRQLAALQKLLKTQIELLKKSSKD
jgi:hypothetical protein